MIGVSLLSLGLMNAALAERAGPAAASAGAKPQIGEHELMLITDDKGTVLDVMEYVYVGVSGAELIGKSSGEPGDTGAGMGALPLAALRVGHAGLPLAQADLAALPSEAAKESVLLDLLQQGVSGLDSALPSLPGVYQVSSEVATVAQYQAAFAQLHQAYTEAGLNDVEAQVRDLDRNGLSDVLLDVLDSGLAPPDFVAFWETFDAQPFFEGIDTVEGDFHHLLDALMLNEQGFQQLLAARGFTLTGFLERLAQRQLPPAYLLSDAVAYAADPGAFIDWVMAKGDGPDAVAQVPLMAGSAAPGQAGDPSQADANPSQVAWEVLGEMGKIGARIDLLARMNGQGLNPHGDHQPAIDGGLQPEGGVLDSAFPGKSGSWSYDVTTYRLSPAGWTLISDVALDLDATTCAQYNNLGSAPGQFARQWQLSLGVAQGDPAILLYPSQQANRGSYLGGRNTGNPADVLQVSLERIPLAISPASGQAAQQAADWGGGHRHEVDLIITGDGWAYLLNSLPPDEGGRLPPENLARLASSRTALLCNPTAGTPSGDRSRDQDVAQTPADIRQTPPRQDGRSIGGSASQNDKPLPSTQATSNAIEPTKEPNSEATGQRFVQSDLDYNTFGYARPGVEAAVFYKGFQYYFRVVWDVLSRPHALEVFPAKINTQGAAERTGEPTEIHWSRDDDRNFEHVAATVARDCIYVTWTNHEGPDTAAWMKWSCNDGTQWFPEAGPQRIGTIPGRVRDTALSSYSERGPGGADGIEWLVLVYTTDADPAHIGVLANSGAGWVGGHKYRRPWNHGEWHRLAAQNVTGSDGDEVVLVAATTSGDGAGADQYLLRMQSFNGTWHTQLRYTPLDWTRHDLDLAMAPGTLATSSMQDQRTIQIFGINSGSFNSDLRNYEFPLVGRYADQGYLRGPVDAGFPHYYSGRIRMTAVPGFAKTNEGVRQYITTAVWYDGITGIRTATYPSDRYVDLGVANKHPVNTAFGPTRMRSAWTLIGVIEGVPPFTRNGRPVGEINVPVSKVEYAESKQKALTLKNSYAFDMKMALGGDNVGVSAEVGYGIELIRSSKQTITITEERFFENDERNEDGEYGYLLFARPSLNNYRYRWLSAAGQELGIINQLTVPNYTLGSESYRLTGDDRYPGLPKRWPTGEPRAWRRGLTPHEGIPGQEQIALQCGLDPATRGGGGRCAFEEARTNAIEVSQHWSVELSSGVVDALKFSAGSRVGLSNAIETTEIRSGRAFVGTLPKPEPGYPDPIEKLDMMGYWIEADPKSDEKPYWVPDEFRFQRPWLMTWRVGAIEPDDRGNPEVEPFRQELETLLQPR